MSTPPPRRWEEELLKAREEAQVAQAALAESERQVAELKCELALAQQSTPTLTSALNSVSPTLSEKAVVRPVALEFGNGSAAAGEEDVDAGVAQRPKKFARPLSVAVDNTLPSGTQQVECTPLPSQPKTDEIAQTERELAELKKDVATAIANECDEMELDDYELAIRMREGMLADTQRLKRVYEIVIESQRLIGVLTASTMSANLAPDELLNLLIQQLEEDGLDSPDSESLEALDLTWQKATTLIDSELEQLQLRNDTLKDVVRAEMDRRSSKDAELSEALEAALAAQGAQARAEKELREFQDRRGEAGASAEVEELTQRVEDLSETLRVVRSLTHKGMLSEVNRCSRISASLQQMVEEVCEAGGSEEESAVVPLNSLCEVLASPELDYEELDQLWGQAISGLQSSMNRVSERVRTALNAQRPTQPFRSDISSDSDEDEEVKTSDDVTQVGDTAIAANSNERQAPGPLSECTDTELEEHLYQLFRAADSAGEGVLRPEDAAKLLSTSGFELSPSLILDMVQAGDINGDGVIEYEEFAAVSRAIIQADRNKGTGEKEAIVDVGQYNWALIPEDELDEYLRKLFYIADENDDGVLQPLEFVELIRLSQLGFPDAVVLQSFVQADLNEDGVIEYEEFVGTFMQMLRAAQHAVRESQEEAATLPDLESELANAHAELASVREAAQVTEAGLVQKLEAHQMQDAENQRALEEVAQKLRESLAKQQALEAELLSLKAEANVVQAQGEIADQKEAGNDMTSTGESEVGAGANDQASVAESGTDHRSKVCGLSGLYLMSKANPVLQASALFKLADKNQDLVLSKKEMKNFAQTAEGAPLRELFDVQHLGWARMWTAIDANEDGQFSEEEFVAAYVTAIERSHSAGDAAEQPAVLPSGLVRAAGKPKRPTVIVETLPALVEGELELTPVTAEPIETDWEGELARAREEAQALEMEMARVKESEQAHVDAILSLKEASVAGLEADMGRIGQIQQAVQSLCRSGSESVAAACEPHMEQLHAVVAQLQAEEHEDLTGESAMQLWDAFGTAADQVLAVLLQYSRELDQTSEQPPDSQAKESNARVSELEHKLDEATAMLMEAGEQLATTKQEHATVLTETHPCQPALFPPLLVPVAHA